jgi:hypothetical protein
MSDFKTQLELLKAKLSSESADKTLGNNTFSDNKKFAPNPSRLDIVIGLDFGTRFTKVAYRIHGVDRRVVVKPDPLNAESALFKSVVFIDSKSLSVSRTRNTSRLVQEELPYIKLLLKDLKQPATLVPLLLQKAIDQNSIKAIAAFYLAGVLQSALGVITRDEKERLIGKNVYYALNISLPAEHYDDAATERFKEVAAVALEWAKGELGRAQSALLPELMSNYDAVRASAVSRSEVGVIPEIVAALYHLIERRDTPNGIHGFLDIGGGTIDGCIFRLIRESNQAARVNILGAKVAPLGTIVVAKKALGVMFMDLEKKIESEIVTCEDIEISVSLPLASVATELQNFAGALLVSARDRCPGHSLVHDGASTFSTAEIQRELRDKFVVLLTGGGAKSGWYKRVFDDVHEARKLIDHGIMGYQSRIISAPRDFDSSKELPFERFVIAYGLTTDAVNLESLRTKLPSQLQPVSEMSAAVPVSIAYADSKDAYT